MKYTSLCFSEDRSETGHILGRADMRGQDHPQERLLSPVHCSCLRLLTHMAMFLAAANDPQVKSLCIYNFVQFNLSYVREQIKHSEHTLHLVKIKLQVQCL